MHGREFKPCCDCVVVVLKDSLQQNLRYQCNVSIVPATPKQDCIQVALYKPVKVFLYLGNTHDIFRNLLANLMDVPGIGLPVSRLAHQQ